MDESLCMKLILGPAVVAIGLAAATAGGAHIASERHIPIGQSPGMSGKHTVIGAIGGVNAGLKSITVTASRGSVPVIIEETTQIWVDRSRYGRPSLVGKFSDLLPGRTVEVKFAEPPRERTADWVKVEGVEPRATGALGPNLP